MDFTKLSKITDSTEGTDFDALAEDLLDDLALNPEGGASVEHEGSEVLATLSGEQITLSLEKDGELIDDLAVEYNEDEDMVSRIASALRIILKV